MKTKFCYLDPGAIMGVVVALIILAVGTFAFYVTLANIPNTSGNSMWYQTSSQMNNTSGVGNQVFNIVGVVLIIGAIMSIVGLVYNYVR